MNTTNNISPATLKNVERATRKAFPGERFAELRKGIRQILKSVDPVAGLESLARHLSDPSEAHRVSVLAVDLTADIERDERVAAGRLEAITAVQSNRCPQCGRPVRRNLSITGWIQCSQFGADTHRADKSQPACPWQGFTC